MFFDTILNKILKYELFHDNDTLYVVMHIEESKCKHSCVIWKNGERFIITPTMRTKKLALTVAAAAIEGSALTEARYVYQ